MDMMMEKVDPADAGREAIARLQTMILESREIAKNGGNLEGLYEEFSEDLVAALWMLDLYLTGTTKGRKPEDDAKRFHDLYIDGKPYHAHLSDGGYSRISVFLEEGHPVRLDLSLSREPVKKKWASLFPPS